MSASRESKFGPQPAQASSRPKPLSCVTCRQRKIKCDKANPCSHCQKAGVQCVFPSRMRVPRATQAGSKIRDMELLRRISRLESLVSKIDAENLAESHENDPTTTELSTSVSSNIANEFSKRSSLDESYTAFIKQQGTSKPYLGGEFWASLFGEFNGLRQLLEDSPDDEDALDDSTSNSTETKPSSPNFILSGPFTSSDLEPGYPSAAHRSTLLQIYFANVDPVCKILHKPTSMMFLKGADTLLEESTSRFKYSSIEAISFAMYFAAVTTLSASECLDYFVEEKDVLVARYKQSTEVALSKADFMNSMEIVTLQALTLYMMALRSNDTSRSSWTLIGLAVRIAHGLGIHRDGDGRGHTAFGAEMRRRLWWELIILDMKASEDRGSEPLIAEYTFNTMMPLNLNDEDMHEDSPHPLQERNGLTEMTFFLICADMSNTARKVNFVPPAREHLPFTHEQKEELAKQCSERIESQHLAGCNPNDPHQWLLYMLGRLLVLKLWSVIQYPLQSRQSTARNFPRGQGLRTVVSLLEVIELVENHESAKGFSWYYQTYVPWHSLAIALTELCIETCGPLAERAWTIIDTSYDKWSDRVADTKQGMLWRPIKTLMKRAQTARQRAQDQIATQVLFQQTVLNQVEQESKVIEELPNLSLDPSQGVYSNMALGQGFDLTNPQPYPLFEPITSL